MKERGIPLDWGADMMATTSQALNSCAQEKKFLMSDDLAGLVEFMHAWFAVDLVSSAKLLIDCTYTAMGTVLTCNVPSRHILLDL